MIHILHKVLDSCWSRLFRREDRWRSTTSLLWGSSIPQWYVAAIANSVLIGRNRKLQSNVKVSYTKRRPKYAYEVGFESSLLVAIHSTSCTFTALSHISFIHLGFNENATDYFSNKHLLLPWVKQELPLSWRAGYQQKSWFRKTLGCRKSVFDDKAVSIFSSQNCLIALSHDQILAVGIRNH